jgi:hypothetical protein
MLGRRPEGIDNADTRVRPERWDQVVEQGVRLCDLVIHVHEDRNVDRTSWQPRIVWLTTADCNVLQSEVAHAVRGAIQLQPKPDLLVTRHRPALRKRIMQTVSMEGVRLMLPSRRGDGDRVSLFPMDPFLRPLHPLSARRNVVVLPMTIRRPRKRRGGI